MSSNADQTTAPHALGTRSARGLVYLFASSTAAKLVSFGTQIILLYLLGRSDFGVVSLAFTITVFIQVIEQAGVGDVLVRRRLFRLWAIPAFWFSLTLGLVSCGLILLSAPIASVLYGKEEAVRDQLFWVLTILALSSIPNSLAVVPRAQLSRDLRFRALAGVNLANVTIQKLLTVVFAALGFGPYSFVLPTPIAGALIAAFLWWWARPPWALRPRVDRWRYFFGDSSLLLVGDFGRALLDQSDRMVLGLFRTVELVGLYTVGYLFSLQMMQLLMLNLTNILFPAFTKLNEEPQRQLQGFLKAQRILAMLGVSGCFLQAAVAGPFSRLVFPPGKWEPSIAIVEVLSLGMATRMLAGASFALIKAQGRFRTILLNRWSFLVLQVASLVVVLVAGGNILHVAITVSLIASLIGPVTMHMALRPYGAGWRAVADVLVPPIVCGTLSVGTAWAIARGMGSAGHGDLAQLIVIVLVAVAINIVLARLWMRTVWDDLWRRVRRLMPLRLQPDPGTATP